MRYLPLLFCALGFLCTPVQALQPNVILVMTDDQGYGDLSCHGNPDFNTPNLDRLHGESVRFTDFHVDPTCAPTRAALITGRYSLSTGVWHTIAGRSFLHPEEVTLADVFKNGGYTTGMFGKWHLGDNYPCRPHDRGFDTAVYHGGGGVGQTPDLWGNDYFDDRYFHNGKPTQYKGYCTDVFFDEAMKFMKQEGDKPFFCYLLPNAPHGPYYVADKYSKPFRDKGFSKNRADFYGMLVNFDENMGRLEEFLKREGLRENTIVIFMTDNGTAGPWYPKEGKDHTDGLRGIKGSIYEGGHRVPFFVRWPAGKIGGGRDVSTLAAHIDVLPTLAELCGVERKTGPELHGRSLAPLLREPDAGWKDRKLVVNNQRIAEPQKYKDFVVMSRAWRLVGKEELYHMKDDRGQERNVAADNPEVVADLMKTYEEWWKQCSGRAGTLVPISVGHDAENPAFLTAHDWHAKKIPWHQEVVAEAPAFNGHWEIDVAQDGSYRITLMERPPEAEFPINATKATLTVGGSVLSKEVASGAKQVSFDLDLKAGLTQLESTLVNKAGTERGAYYASVLRLAGKKDAQWKKHTICKDKGRAITTAVAADFTGDGRIDVITSFDGRVSLFAAPDWKESLLHSLPAPKGQCIHSETIDVDRDGDPDWIGSLASGKPFWLENPGGVAGEWTARTIDHDIRGIHCLLKADIDKDGHPDLIVNNFQPEGPLADSIVWLKIPKGVRDAPHWERHVFADGDAQGGSHYFGFGDLDGDGWGEITVGAKGKPFENGNWFAYWKNPGAERLAKPWVRVRVADDETGATNILPGDLNGDGRPDLLASNGHGVGVFWFEAPDWKRHQIDPDLRCPHSLALADFDDDGDLDAASCGFESERLSLYFNDGRDKFRRLDLDDDQQSYDLRPVDMDGDGDLDLLNAGRASRNVAWYENPLR